MSCHKWLKNSQTYRSFTISYSLPKLVIFGDLIELCVMANFLTLVWRHISQGHSNYMRSEAENEVSQDDAVEYLKKWRPKDDGVAEKLDESFPQPSTSS